MLDPGQASSSTVRHSTFMRAPGCAMVPTSSTIPVNITAMPPSPRGAEMSLGTARKSARATSLDDVSFHGEFIDRNGMQLHAMEADGIFAALPARAAHHRQRLNAP